MTTTAHGPGRVPSLCPGKTGTVMISVTSSDPTQALTDTLPWLSAFEADCGMELITTETALYALADPQHLALEHEELPARGPNQYIDAILSRGQWKVRGDDPAAWTDTYNAALDEAPQGTIITLWDVHPRP